MCKLSPCPKCGNPVKEGRLIGGIAAHGCAEFEYEVECECGIVFSHQCMAEDFEDAIAEGVEAWNTRAERTCKMQRVRREKTMDEFECQTCYGHTWTPVYVRPEYCCHCGSNVVE